MNIRTITTILAVSLLFSLNANGLWAMDKKHCADENAQSNCQADNKDKWEEIESAKIAFFTTYIGITPEEAKTFWPIYNNYSKESRELHKATRKSLKAVKELSERGKFSDLEMKKLLKEYLDNFEKEGEHHKLYLEEFYKILPVEKVAKIFLAEEEFRINMIRMWERNGNKEKSHNNPHSK